ncbi:hypothetical protein BV98_001862 [Sphingobium herbicidovorans NBRC 16415]|uniref:Uncharacterized protein n=1 Tax=Sphingobium herbicidovorans (strain ATCC 700291 / DSM 11019 / CCUG 56400 / KCTC 2939 / LMG 18315 / NBRC 16415 / MH) TaxID=1219045 RepID=A0A086PB90_SPHHM|nr:hypothetical protein BV98_001862 [Sphingobium herbicidovorans NBRC 16415]
MKHRPVESRSGSASGKRGERALEAVANAYNAGFKDGFQSGHPSRKHIWFVNYIATNKKGAAGQATPFILSAKAVGFVLVGFRLEVDGGVFAATIYFQFEVQAVAFVEGGHACAFHGADVDERVGLTVVALDEAEALHGVEELDSAAGAFTGQLTLRATAAFAAAEAAAFSAEAACTGFAGCAILYGERLAFNLEVGRRNLAATVHQGKAELLTFGQAGQARLLNGADVDEHVLCAIVTDDEAEALLPVEEFDYASAFANDLRGHATAAAATAAETTAAAAAAAAEAATAAAAETAATAAATEAAAVTTAETTTITAAEAATKTAAIAAIKIIVAETVALILAAPAAATSIKTHALLVTFASPLRYRINMPGEDMQNPPQHMRFGNHYISFSGQRE